jgi:RNA:NAD 2'-phosphotransferase (TPT1/KptA family)
MLISTAVGEHVYHGTDRGRLESIKIHGLRPNEYGNPVNFHVDLESARYYSGPRGDRDSLMLRVRTSHLPSDIRHQASMGHLWTRTVVPPHHIEVEQGTGWRKLDEVHE